MGVMMKFHGHAHGVTRADESAVGRINPPLQLVQGIS